MADSTAQDQHDNSAEAYIDPSKLKQRRKAADMTQMTLAEESGVSVQMIRLIEQWRDPAKGDAAPKRTTWGTVKSLAGALRCEPEDLLAPGGSRDSASRSAPSSQLASAATALVDTAAEVDAVLTERHLHGLILADRWSGHGLDVIARRQPPIVESSIDFQEYADRLVRFTDEDRASVRAIADMADQLESPLWSGGPGPGDSWVRERIFVMPLQTFRSRGLLEKIIGLLSAHASFDDTHYTVRLGVAHKEGHGPSHPLGQRALGLHLLLIAPDTYGGYRIDNRTARKRQVLITNHAGYAAAEAFYSAIRRRSFVYTSGMPDREVRAALYKLLGAGTFERDWASHDERPDRYFELYDANICAWIPWYTELNECAARVVRQEVAARYRTGRGSHILEIGYGTGAVTESLVSWATAANSVLGQDEAEHACVTAFSGLDAARQMHRALPSELKANGLCNFVQGTFGPEAIEMATRGRPVDVLFGTLVFHDIMGRERSRNLTQFFSTLSRCMSPGSVVVLGDVFMSSEEHVRERQMTTWRTGMYRRGLTEEQISQFLECNPEMIATIERPRLSEEAVKHGFVVDRALSVTKPDVLDIPFHTVVLKRV